MTAHIIPVGEARRRLHGGSEIALLDVREAGQFGEAHPLFATPCPFSRLEILAPRLMPQLTVPVLLLDAGDGVAEQAALRLAELGYTEISVITGGMPAWVAAGFPVYKGVNVPSKTLGELAEEIWHPSMLAPEQLAAWKADGRDFRFFDARPADEYRKMRVPGAVCLPNGELAHRLPAVVEPDETIVITCAGRTRGIIGAIGARLAGHQGPVLALENGTQGWALAGEALERGNTAAAFPALSPAEAERTRAAAQSLISRFRIDTIDTAEIDGLLSDHETTTYLLDVRSAAEAAADPIPGAAHAPSGQLVQATDQWVAVRHARLVLLDDLGLRAGLAAFWLRQLGYRPYVAIIDDGMRQRASRNDAARRDHSVTLPSIMPEDALRLCSEDRAVFIDLRGSLAYRNSHVDGAVWLVRPKAGSVADSIGGRAALLITDDRLLAELAAKELREAGIQELSLAEGGHQSLVDAGARTVSTPDTPSDAEAIDHLFFVHDRHDGNLESSRRYLAWETGLIAQLDDVERAEYLLEHP
ncbi:Rhodanese domain protein [Pseudorhizobium banfieldiae]|uniref:Rhodanese domain protein n=1 Tax=Pseudorhizobium banfieldiae TaxID=1125847 RepID=L0NDN8_9HYPH|nr:rhodanese-like domain-containing protein [Pseudorhizobium banfieldiae]CAD6602360.1 rhodanese-like domain-containing protein [arsenite-oxidising bacterium NT-25]CCF18432.1 Rhodanese domain protein [Pseudorhizobium banfieldiae]